MKAHFLFLVHQKGNKASWNRFDPTSGIAQQVPLRILPRKAVKSDSTYITEEASRQQEGTFSYDRKHDRRG